MHQTHIHTQTRANRGDSCDATLLRTFAVSRLLCESARARLCVYYMTIQLFNHNIPAHGMIARPAKMTCLPSGQPTGRRSVTHQTCLISIFRSVNTAFTRARVCVCWLELRKIDANQSGRCLLLLVRCADSDVFRRFARQLHTMGNNRRLSHPGNLPALIPHRTYSSLLRRLSAGRRAARLRSADR